MGKRYRTYVSPKAKKRDKEIIESVEQAMLRRKIKRLQQLPDDFRDIEPGTKAWEDYYELVPQRREDMRNWASGPVLTFQDLSDLEYGVLIGRGEDAKKRLLRTITTEIKISWDLLLTLIQEAERDHASFIYIKGYKVEGLINALNKIASEFKFKFRFKGTLKSVLDKESTLDMKITHGR